LYNAVHDPANSYATRATMMPHTPEQIRELIGVA
jgi:hypothetical protein